MLSYERVNKTLEWAHIQACFPKLILISQRLPFIELCLDLVHLVNLIYFNLSQFKENKIIM